MSARSVGRSAATQEDVRSTALPENDRSAPAPQNARRGSARQGGRSTTTRAPRRSAAAPQEDRSFLCTFTFTDDRQCRSPRKAGHPYLCVFHARKDGSLLKVRFGILEGTSRRRGVLLNKKSIPEWRLSCQYNSGGWFPISAPYVQIRPTVAISTSQNPVSGQLPVCRPSLPKPLPVARGNGPINYFLRLGSSLGLT